MAAALLALQPGHDAATPTRKRQGRLVTAEALPTLVGFLSPRAMRMHDLRETYQPRTKTQMPDANMRKGIATGERLIQS
jgi:hypothetical protein